MAISDSNICIQGCALVCVCVCVCVCVRMQTLEEKISAHNAEPPNIVLQLKTEVDALHNKLEVRHRNNTELKAEVRALHSKLNIVH